MAGQFLKHINNLKDGVCGYMKKIVALVAIMLFVLSSFTSFSMASEAGPESETESGISVSESVYSDVYGTDADSAAAQVNEEQQEDKAASDTAAIPDEKDSQIKVYINGARLVFDEDAEPYIDSSRTLIPLRKVAEALSAKVDWDAAGRLVTIEKGANTIKLKIDDEKAVVNDKEVKLDVPAKITNDRTYVPFRFVSEYLGTKVSWDENTRSIGLECPYITVSFDKTKAGAGEIIKATVEVGNLESLVGYQFNLKYDADVLQAVDPLTGEPYTDTTAPAPGDLIINPDFDILPLTANKVKDGIINAGKVYINFDEYKNSNKPEKDGSIAVIGFKVLKAVNTSIKFEDADTMPAAICGAMLFDWDENLIDELIVVQPPSVN